MLRSMSGYQTYRRHVAIQGQPRGRAGFPVSQPAVSAFVPALHLGGRRQHRQDGKLGSGITRHPRAQTQTAPGQRGGTEPGGAARFIDELQLGIIELHNSLAETYFRRHRYLEEAG